MLLGFLYSMVPPLDCHPHLSPEGYTTLHGPDSRILFIGEVRHICAEEQQRTFEQLHHRNVLDMSVEHISRWILSDISHLSETSS